ncbi:hypothetical protein ACHAWF_013945 [Thalassiosira exigua]
MTGYRPSSSLNRSDTSTGIVRHVNNDVEEFSESYDPSAPPVGLDMGGHDTYLMGPKVVMLDSFVVDLLHVDTSAQTFRLKLLLNMDWEDDGTIESEYKAKRNLGRTTLEQSMFRTGAAGSDFSGASKGALRSTSSVGDDSVGAASGAYKTGKYVLKREFQDDPLGSTWNPEVVLVNAIADEDPIEAGSKLHCVHMLSRRPVVSRTVLYQPECRCEFTFSNFPFDETDLVVKFSSNKWNSEQRMSFLLGREGSFLKQSVDQNAIRGVGLSEFEIVKVRVETDEKDVRVETDEKDVNSMQRYDNAVGSFSQAHLVIRVRRDPYSYLLRVASVSELLMFLEVLSFLTDSGDLSARFSISGTIFLAMVSLYGPMADALPQVSVVTRVDKWHLHNFFLLFASSVENLVAFVVRYLVKETVMRYTEALLGVLYLIFVIRNFIWFIDPLKDREEYTDLLMWFEDKYEEGHRPAER